VATGRPVATLGGHTAPVAAMAFAPGGRTLATGLRMWEPPADGPSEVKVWSVPAGELLAEIPVGGPPATSGFGPDGRWLMTAGGPNGWTAWDITIVPPRPLDGLPALKSRASPTRPPWLLPVFSPDGGRMVLPADEAGAARLFDTRTMRLVATLRTPPVPGWDNELFFANFWPGSRLVWLLKRGDVTVWPDTPRAWLDRVLRRNGRSVLVEGVWLFDAETGRGPVELPRDRNWQCWIADPDGRGLWASSFRVGPWSSDGHERERFDLWPAPAGPPWWLWALTAAVVILTVADWWRVRRPAAQTVAHNA
jgi:hypothetical protein